jgi:hypothetical protein
VSKILILVEGQTEETFVREVLAPYLEENGVYPIPKLVTTKRVKSRSPDFKGGISSYGKIRKDIVRLLGDTSAAIVTTMIDFYGLPADFPGRESTPPGSCYDRVAYLEAEMQRDINHCKFLPYLALHEFEAMMFVDPQQIAKAFPDRNMRRELSAIRTQFDSPEEIDDSSQTAPSKRLEKLFPEYRKALHGPLVILEIGIGRIRAECPHFDAWLQVLRKLPPNPMTDDAVS